MVCNGESALQLTSLAARMQADSNAGLVWSAAGRWGQRVSGLVLALQLCITSGRRLLVTEQADPPAELLKSAASWGEQRLAPSKGGAQTGCKTSQRPLRIAGWQTLSAGTYCPCPKSRQKKPDCGNGAGATAISAGYFSREVDIGVMKPRGVVWESQGSCDGCRLFFRDSGVWGDRLVVLHCEALGVALRRVIQDDPSELIHIPAGDTDSLIKAVTADMEICSRRIRASTWNKSTEIA